MLRSKYIVLEEILDERFEWKNLALSQEHYQF